MKPININGLRDAAKKRLPKAVFDYIDGGAQDEITLRRNNSDFQDFEFIPRILTDISNRTQVIELFGESLGSPLIMAPIGLAGFARREGEIQAAKAAEHHNIPFCLSSMASCSIEQIGSQAPGSNWFQLYVLKDKGLTKEFIQRADDAKCSALVITVDIKIQGPRERDIRNGLVVPPKFTSSTILDFITHVRWLTDVALGPKIKYRNLENSSVNADDVMSINDFIKAQWDLKLNWDDIVWFKEQWDGPVLIKGILSTEDAKIAHSLGIDGIVVSNHGGRQLDQSISTIKALTRIKQVVPESFPLILDGGVRRGSDVIKAICLGASACMFGRPWMYGLAFDGKNGVNLCLEILKSEIDIALGLLGVSDINDLNHNYLSRVSD